ncbi:hypothetical protein K450DRAFT_225012 [Umbelopsis ramanniana AG]|uniref:Uncharacterized protein n=1 Tax=Umbelopsis ramanniana AG TaxID=1314678 RepID=A0AAD5EGY0_UMBRA|nr:uncharacterized protein K450DRAFT_225012 [Umbelopsis ramanniana AG]KAI8582830.1 hypothetical protein K450DRAFT_225012 [Umbelopsis ramanniana AG]
MHVWFILHWCYALLYLALEFMVFSIIEKLRFKRYDFYYRTPFISVIPDSCINDQFFFLIEYLRMQVRSQ